MYQQEPSLLLLLLVVVVVMVMVALGALGVDVLRAAATAGAML
jgi:hypothetical protein